MKENKRSTDLYKYGAASSFKLSFDDDSNSRRWGIRWSSNFSKLNFQFHRGSEDCPILGTHETEM